MHINTPITPADPSTHQNFLSWLHTLGPENRANLRGLHVTSVEINLNRAKTAVAAFWGLRCEFEMEKIEERPCGLGWIVAEYEVRFV